MKNESAPQDPVVEAGRPKPALHASNDFSTLLKTSRPRSPIRPPVQFQEIPIGGHFEFRGRRYRKLALSMASDEDRNGTIFMAQTEVLPDPLAHQGSSRET